MEKMYKAIDEVEFSNGIISKIINYINEQKISLSEFAKRIRLTERGLRKILRGKSLPKLSTLRNIVRELNISFDDFFDFEFKEIKK